MRQFYAQGAATPKSELYPWFRSDLSVEDKRKALHEELRTPERNNHDAFIYLTTLGNKDSVPLIIKAFRWQPNVGRSPAANTLARPQTFMPPLVHRLVRANHLAFAVPGQD